MQYQHIKLGMVVVYTRASPLQRIIIYSNHLGTLIFAPGNDYFSSGIEVISSHRTYMSPVNLSG